MDWKDRLASIGANLDDLQSGVEGGSHAADGVRRDLAAMNGTPAHPGSSDLLRALIQHVTDMEIYASHQLGAMRELRQNLARLGRELNAVKLGS